MSLNLFFFIFFAIINSLIILFILRIIFIQKSFLKGINSFFNCKFDFKNLVYVYSSTLIVKLFEENNYKNYEEFIKDFYKEVKTSFNSLIAEDVLKNFIFNVFEELEIEKNIVKNNNEEILKNINLFNVFKVIDEKYSFVFDSYKANIEDRFLFFLTFNNVFLNKTKGASYLQLNFDLINKAFKNKEEKIIGKISDLFLNIDTNFLKKIVSYEKSKFKFYKFFFIIFFILEIFIIYNIIK